MDDEKQRLTMLLSELEESCAKSARAAGSVRLLAVSKSHPAAAIRALHAAGQRAFGENRLQEALDKQAALRDLDIEWHYIGAIQSNKTRDIAEHFDWVQSVDRPRILERLAEQRPPGLPPLNVCLQVNIDAEPQKSGVAPDQVEALARHAAGLEHITLRGLMCIPRHTDDPVAARDSLLRMRRLYASLMVNGLPLDTLSMGMSSDWPLAVAEGSTMVRVGTRLFGPRETSQHPPEHSNP
jgi:pyridoxal phosphate enzyme (YggS family)